MKPGGQRRKGARWRECRYPGLTNYLVSDDGQVRRKRRGLTRSNNLPIKGCINQGYIRYHLMSDDGGKMYVHAHQLVLWTWKGPPPSKHHQAAHHDGIRSNNFLKNLDWKTPKGNGEDKRRHGSGKGMRNGRAKLTDSQVCSLRKEYQIIKAKQRGGYGKLADLRNRYGIASTTLLNIVKRKLWSHI